MFSESILVCFYSNPSSNSLTPLSTITRRSTLSTTLFFTDHPVQHSIILFETNSTLLSSLLLHTLDLLLHCDNASWWFHCWSCATERSDPSSSTLSFFGSHSNSSFSFSFRFRQVDWTVSCRYSSPTESHTLQYSCNQWSTLNTWMHGIFSHFVQWQSHGWLLSFTSKWYTLMWALSTTSYSSSPFHYLYPLSSFIISLFHFR